MISVDVDARGPVFDGRAERITDDLTADAVDVVAEAGEEQVAVEDRKSVATQPANLAGSLEQAEQELILEALRAGNGSRRAAAEKLGISQRTLRYKLARLRELGVNVPAA